MRSTGCKDMLTIMLIGMIVITEAINSELEEGY